MGFVVAVLRNLCRSLTPTHHVALGKMIYKGEMAIRTGFGAPSAMAMLWAEVL